MQVYPIVGGLVVTWSGTSNGVQWKSGGEAYSLTQRITPFAARDAAQSSRSYTITGLTPGTTYTLRVVRLTAGNNIFRQSADVTGTPVSQNVTVYPLVGGMRGRQSVTGSVVPSGCPITLQKSIS